MYKRVDEVVQQDLCTGCGTCSSMCPKEAITIKIDEKKGIYIPKISSNLCNDCGICAKVCPGYSVDFKYLNEEIFNENPKNKKIGSFLDCYIGNSKDCNIRYNSASGGIITQILIFALEQRIIDGAIVTKMCKDDPLKPEIFVATTKEEIIEASKSKYCPVSLNTVLKQIMESEENKKFAVVGLPCHIHGIRKAEQINKKLKNKIPLHIGIFCGHTPNFLATSYILSQKKINEKDIINLNYRGRGWPGGVCIKLKNNQEIFIDHTECWSNGFGSYFFPIRCTLCQDGVAELADISVGDAWLPEIREMDKEGTSIIISRSKYSDEVLKKCEQMREIELKITSAEKVVESQKRMLNFKKKSLKARIVILKLINKRNPNYNLKLEHSDIIDYITSVEFYLLLYISSKKLWNLLKIHNTIKGKIIKFVGYHMRKLGILFYV